MSNINLLYIDLFCGAGGTSTGVESAKDMICGVEMALGETAYDLIYERKDEYDFE